MKRRLGLISNSSSSSFVVKIWDSFDLEKEKALISQEEIELLTAYGFKPCNCLYASIIEIGGDLHNKREDGSFVSLEESNGLYYKVSCNQDEVIAFLLKRKIPFTASCHYAHENIFYPRGGKEFMTVRNFGLIYEMYDSLQFWSDKELKNIERINVEDFIGENSED